MIQAATDEAEQVQRCEGKNYRCINSEHLYLLKADFVRHKAWAVHRVHHAIFDPFDPLHCHTLSHISGLPSVKYVTHLGLLIFSSRSTYIHVTYIIYFRGFVVGSQSLLTWGFCPGSSRAPTSLCRRRRAAVSKISGSAAAVAKGF